MAARARPSFRNPPLVEVVCGFQFRPLPLFQATHYGLFWQTVRKDFPSSRTVLPLGGSPQLLSVSPDQPTSISVDLEPDFPRVWLVSADDSSLIQLQKDRFLLNWRRGEQVAKYPRYPTVIRRFKKLFGKFSEFVKQNRLGELSVLDMELSYINHIPQGSGWTHAGDLSKLFPDFSWRAGDRYLSRPTSVNFRSLHLMPGGRLQIAIMTAKEKSGTEVVRFGLTARGVPTEIGEEDLWQWFDEANTWIVDAFIDLTSSDIQNEVWQRVA
jgi:uncharacterized protein (TIGR04255 family)